MTASANKHGNLLGLGDLTKWSICTLKTFYQRAFALLAYMNVLVNWFLIFVLLVDFFSSCKPGHRGGSALGNDTKEIWVLY